MKTITIITTPVKSIYEYFTRFSNCGNLEKYYITTIVVHIYGNQ